MQIKKLFTLIVTPISFSKTSDKVANSCHEIKTTFAYLQVANTDPHEYCRWLLRPENIDSSKRFLTTIQAFNYILFKKLETLLFYRRLSLVHSSPQFLLKMSIKNNSTMI